MSDDGKIVPDISHYPTGAIRYTGFQLDGAAHGAWAYFRLDGSVMRTGSFERGTQVGAWPTFDRTGRVLEENGFSARGMSGTPGKRKPPARGGSARGPGHPSEK